MANGGGPMWTPPILDLAVDRYAAWKNWNEKWKDYGVVTELEKKPKDYQCSILRYTFTDETRKIYNTLKLSEEDSKDPEKIITVSDNFAKRVINETLERHTLNSRTQEIEESFDDFITDVKIFSKNCNFCDNCHDSLIRDRIVAGIRDDRSENKLTLKTAEDICRAKEKAFEGAKTLQKQDKEEMVEPVVYNKPQPTYYRNKNNKTYGNNNQQGQYKTNQGNPY